MAYGVFLDAVGGGGRRALPAYLLGPLALWLSVCRAVAAPLGENAGLLQQEERAEQARRSLLEEWCSHEVAAQTSQRDELRDLRDQVSPLVGDEAQVQALTQQAAGLSSRLELNDALLYETEKDNKRVHTVMEDINKQVVALTQVQEKLQKSRRKGTFLQSKNSQAARRAIGAVDTLLERAKAEASRVHETMVHAREPAEVQRDALIMEDQYQKKNDELMHMRTQRLAALKGQSLLLAALEDQDTFLTDVQNICKLSRDVHSRFDAQVLPGLTGIEEELLSLAAQPRRPPPPPPAPPPPPPTPPPPPPPAPAPPPPPPPAPPPPPPPAPPPPPPPAPPPPPPPAPRRAPPPPPPPAPPPPPPPAPAPLAVPPAAQQSRAPPPQPAAEALPEDDEPPPPVPQLRHPHKKQPPPPPADDDNFDDAPPAPRPKRHSKRVAEPPADDFSSSDDFKAPPRRQSEPPPPMPDEDDEPMPVPRHKKTHHPVEDMVDTAKGNWPPPGKSAAADDDFDSTPPAPRHKHARAHSFDDDAGMDPPPSPSSRKSQVPQGFEGGWRSLLKTKAVKKKHKFQDQTNGIMDLVQTPTTYQAWHPDSTDAVLKASAKSELSAAERAFDAPDGSESFLQLWSSDESSTNDGSTAAVAQMLLDQYASTLSSATLLQLSRAELSQAALDNLWKQIASVNTSAAHSEHEAQSIKWCQDFQNQARETMNKRRATARQAAMELAKEETQSIVYGQEAKAQERFYAAVDRDVKDLRRVLSQVSHQFDSTDAVVNKLQEDISRTASTADPSLQSKFFDLQMALGKVQGLVSSGSAEVMDMIKAATSRRDKSGTMWRESLAQVQEAVSDVNKQKERLNEEKAQAVEVSDQEDGLRDRYQQMCQWTLDDFHAKKRQEECEKTAIKAALIVLST